MSQWLMCSVCLAVFTSSSRVKNPDTTFVVTANRGSNSKPLCHQRVWLHKLKIITTTIMADRMHPACQCSGEARRRRLRRKMQKILLQLLIFNKEKENITQISRWMRSHPSNCLMQTIAMQKCRHRCQVYRQDKQWVNDWCARCA